jgi:hypothetical protein
LFNDALVSVGTGATAPRGRAGDCAQIARLLKLALARQSGVLMLSGKAGLGKNSPLEYAIASVAACRVGKAMRSKPCSV